MECDLTSGAITEYSLKSRIRQNFGIEGRQLNACQNTSRLAVVLSDIEYVFIEEIPQHIEQFLQMAGIQTKI